MDGLHLVALDIYIGEKDIYIGECRR